MKQPAVTILLINDKGEFLGVSRKDDHTKFGIVGGKVEEGETFEISAIREAKEETGLDIYDLKEVIDISWKDRHQKTFLAKWKGYIHTNEPHVVKWVTAKELLDGPFSEYNKILLKKLGLLI